MDADAVMPGASAALAPEADGPEAAARKRPKLDLSGAVGEPAGGRERKKGRSMFGMLVGTLTKAKIEDKERSASDAVRGRPCAFVPVLIFRMCSQAKKRQLIDQRLQSKLRRETDSVRRTDEMKKDRSAANRKEEELQLKDSLVRLPSDALRYVPHASAAKTETDTRAARRALPTDHRRTPSR
jgi:hypothetical protein